MPNNVHDVLFKATFSQVEHAAGELRLILPPDLVARIDFATLALCPGSFVDKALAERHTDLLFSVKIRGRPAFLYILFEHQSTPDRWMLLRLLGYMLRIWEAHRKKHPKAKRLPMILPVVLHHSAAGWNACVRFEDLLDADIDTLAAAGEYVPRFRFVLDDLSAENDEALKKRAMSSMGRLALWCLKNGRSPDRLVEQLGRWAEVMREVRRAPNGGAALEAVFRYIYCTNDRLGVDDLRALVAKEVGEDVEEDVVTLGERLVEEGVREGLRRTLLKQLGVRFGALPESALAQVNAADMAHLDQWVERVLTAPTLADVLGRA